MKLQEHEWATILVALHKYAQKTGEEVKSAPTIDERALAVQELSIVVKLINKLRKKRGA